MEVSHLRVKVDSEGIAEVSKKLAGLGTSAKNAEEKVSKLTATIAHLIGQQSKLAASQQSALAVAQQQAHAFANLQTVTGQIAATMQRMAAAATALGAGMQTLTTHSNKAASAIQNKNHWGGVMISTLKAMATAAIAYNAVNIASSVIKQADAWQMMQARLNVATGSLHNAKVAQQQIFELSQRLRSPLEETTRLYTRLAPAMAKMGKDSNQTREMVEGVATALKLSGATGAEMASVMLQFSQAVNAGRLNGAEFNSVAEGAPKILDALEEATGKTRSQLKKMGADGKLSIELIQEAMEKALPKWREDFDKLPLTFDDAMIRLKNAWTKAVGEMGEDTKFNQELSKSLRVIEDMIPGVAEGLGKAFISIMKWIDANKEKLGQMWDQIVLLGQDIWNIAGLLGEWTGKIIGAGESTSFLASGIFGVRLMIAAAVDVMKLFASMVAHVGITVVHALLTPFELLSKMVEKVFSTLAEYVLKLAGAADDIGLDDTAAGLKAMGNGIQSASDKTTMFRENVGQLLTDMRATADGWADGFRTGNTEVQKVLDTTRELNAQQKKIGKYDENYSDKRRNDKDGTDSKAAKAAQKELDQYNKSMDDLNAKIKEQGELLRRLEAHGLDYDKVGQGTRKELELTEELYRLKADGASKEKIQHVQNLIALTQQLSILEQFNERKLEALRAEKAATDKEVNKANSLEEELRQLQYKVATYGLAKDAIEQLETSQLRLNLAEAIMNEASTERIAALERQIALREKLADTAGKLAELEATSELDKLLDPKKADKFGNAMKEAFGKAGQALGKVVDAMGKYEARQNNISKMRAHLATVKDEEKRAKYLKAIQHEETQSAIRGYGDMASAAKGFFDEKSKGYKALESIEKAFRAWEIAMELKYYAEKLGLLSMFTTAKVASDQTQAASAVSGAATEVGAKMAVANANAVAGVANQANGDPYTAFFRMAAMAAIMAGLGLAVGGIGGGGSGGDSAAQRQARAGTGTVFGDDNAKSESISKSIDLLANNSDIALRYSSSMLSSLKNIEASLTGATNAILRNGRTLTGAGFQEIASGSNIGRVFGFGKSTTLKDSGISSGAQYIKDILENGFQGSTYTETNTKKKAFGITYSNKTRRKYSELDDSIEQEFTRVISSMVDTVVMSGEALGYEGAKIKEALNGVTLALGDISLKGLTGEEIEKQLNAVFSGFGDQLVMAGFGGFIQMYQKAGEGLLETAVRVANGSEVATYELEKLGLAAVSWTQLVNKHGDVGAEIVRQSIMLKEAGTGVGEIISMLQGEAADLAATYKDLVTARTLMKNVNLGDDLTRDLIRAAGGLDALTDSLQAYSEGFFSEAEQHAMKVANLRDEFQKLGLAMPASKEAFRQMVELLNGTGQSDLAAKLLNLASAFSEVTESTGGVETARDALRDAYEREIQALEEVRDKFKDFAASLKQFRESLITGDLSPLSNTEKYATLKTRYEEIASKAMSGDETAISKFESIANEFLQFSREYNASGAGYNADFMKVLEQTKKLEEYTAGRASVAEQSLNALKQQVDGLLKLNETVLTVAEAIKQLQDALLRMGQLNGPNGSHANGLSYVPFDGYIAELHEGERVLTAAENKAYTSSPDVLSVRSDEALVGELKALRAEVQQMREQQANHTAALISANYDANERNAQLVVDGTKEAVSNSSYSEKARVSLA